MFLGLVIAAMQRAYPQQTLDGVGKESAKTNGLVSAGT
jgi:hypothetical protein